MAATGPNAQPHAVSTNEPTYSQFATPVAGGLKTKRRLGGLSSSTGTNKRFRVPFKQDASFSTPNINEELYASSDAQFLALTGSDMPGKLQPAAVALQANIMDSEAQSSLADKCTPCLLNQSAQTPLRSKSGLKVARLTFHSPAIISPVKAPILSTDHLKQLKHTCSVKEEQLRKMNIVAYHMKHNNLDELARTTEAWRTAAHKALHELQLLLPEPKPTLKQILVHYQVDPSHVNCEHIDEEDE